MRFLATVLVALCAIAPAAASAAELDGTVVAISDGDTLTLIGTDKRQHRIRLDGIDAPERTQPYGQRARQSLAQLAYGRAAIVNCPKVDRYGREVCRVTIDGVDVGLEQIRRGLAWHYVKYAHEQRAVDRARYAQAESEARARSAGLWSFEDPVPPWDYRRGERAELSPNGS
jgi:endonuclease YncB( thermonuclease family)